MGSNESELVKFAIVYFVETGLGKNGDFREKSTIL
jgi:hypothetical protein